MSIHLCMQLQVATGAQTSAIAVKTKLHKVIGVLKLNGQSTIKVGEPTGIHYVSLGSRNLTYSEYKWLRVWRSRNAPWHFVYIQDVHFVGTVMVWGGVALEKTATSFGNICLLEVSVIKM